MSELKKTSEDFNRRKNDINSISPAEKPPQC